MDIDKRKLQLGLLITCIVIGTLLALWPAIAMLVIYDHFLSELAKVFFVGSNVDLGSVEAIIYVSIALGSLIICIGYLIYNQSAPIRRLLKSIFLGILLYILAYGAFFVAGLIKLGR